MDLNLSVLKPLDKTLLEAAAPYLPEIYTLAGWVVVDVDTLRVFYFDKDKVKKSFLIKAP